MHNRLSNVAEQEYKRLGEGKTKKAKILTVVVCTVAFVAAGGSIVQGNQINILSQQCEVYFYHWDPASEFSYTLTDPFYVNAGGTYSDATVWIETSTLQTNLGISGFTSPSYMVSEMALPSVELVFKSQQENFNMFVESISPFGDYQVGLQLLDLTDNVVLYSARYANESQNLSFNLAPEHSYKILLDGHTLGNNYYSLNVTLPPVPEPATLLLLGLGTEILRRRKFIELHR